MWQAARVLVSVSVSEDAHKDVKLKPPPVMRLLLFVDFC